MAAKGHKLDILLKIWKLAKENITREELNNTLFSATDKTVRTAWYVAAEEGKTDILLKMWEWAKENLTKER
jgi:hypothetical protein